MEIKSYRSIGGLQFGASRGDAEAIFGVPQRVKVNRDGELEYYYNELILRFDSLNERFRECTLLPKTEAVIDDVLLTWDEVFLKKICELDGNPQDILGFIVLMNLGIAVTGIHDNDSAQLAVSVFSKGDWNEFESAMKDFHKYRNN